MKIKELSKEEVLYYCNKEEDHFFDKKAFGVKIRNIQKIAVAFANADGGDILIGVSDEKDEPTPERRWNSIDKIETFNEVFQGFAEIKPSITYQTTFLKNSENNSYALLITIDKSDKVHATADNTVYQRQSAQSLPVYDAGKIHELSLAKGETSFEDSLIKDAQPEDIFETEEMRVFLSTYSPNTDPIDFTINQNLVDRQDYTPRAAGILLYNDNPSTTVPKKCAIKVTRYITREDLPEREHLKSQYNIEGPLYRQIHQTVKKVVEIIQDIPIWVDGELKKGIYPYETLWEIVVNAIIHRDYSISDDIHILIYENRIEVISPGKLPGYVTVENILEARYARNPKIVRTLNRYKDPPNKDMGEGLNTAFQKMEEFRLQNPIISQERNYVKVIIPHTPLASPDDLVLKYLSSHESISNAEGRSITGIKSENTMKNVFYRLRDARKIEPIPNLRGRSSRWSQKK